MSDTKKIWGRIGMTFHLTEEEFHTLQEGGGAYLPESEKRRGAPGRRYIFPLPGGRGLLV